MVWAGPRRLGEEHGGKRHAHPQHPSSAHATSLIRLPLRAPSIRWRYHCARHCCSLRRSTFSSPPLSVSRSKEVPRKETRVRREGTNRSTSIQSNPVHRLLAVHPLYKTLCPSFAGSVHPFLSSPFHCSASAAVSVISFSERKP